MSEPHDTPQDTPQGPVDPHGPGGADAPAPPGGPQRTDSPDGPYGVPPGEHDSELPDADDGEDHSPGRAVQEENAGTSLDEPSDGSGGE
ncbi:hypothetical protein [Nocardioides sp.]|uniref:hypothetical protein n=1 Tax=Nocardioides sp. TaxID=35761 RepID=UPI002EDA9CAB